MHGQSANTNCFTYKSRITGEVTEFYPERGLVTIEGAHERTGVKSVKGKPYYERVSRKEFLIRAAGLSLEIKRLKYSDEKRELVRLLAMMEDVARAAGHQGDPFDRRHMSDMLNDRPRQSVRMGGHSFDPGIPNMPQAPANKPIKDMSGSVPIRPEHLIITPR